MAEASGTLEGVLATSRPLSAVEYARLGRELAARDGVVGLRELRVAVLSSCTMQFVEPSLLVEAARRKLLLRTWFGPFAQFEQQVVDPASPLHGFEAQALVLFMRPEDIDQDVFHRFHAAGRPDVFAAVIERLVGCIDAFREYSSAPVLVANFATPAVLPLGPFEANHERSLQRAIAEANAELRRRVAARAGAVVWDYAGLVHDAGADLWSDPRLWALARIPVAADRQPVLAKHLSRCLAAVTRVPAKCLVLDLDNTLWGGVIGDDGMEGIELGDDYPGNVYKAFQRAALALVDRGILLAVVSKNDAEVVERALREHPEMVIRPEHVSAMRVNWNPKSQNLREIAAELNIGLDALVHFDDNPMERAEIAANAPEVLLVDVPADPIGYERALCDSGFFDATSISQEDVLRVQMYREERAREEVRAQTGTVQEFLSGLGMSAEVGLVDDTTLGRVAQLIGKTNQFNLTTRRHSQADVRRMARDTGYAVSYLRLRDRFGDLGLIAATILEFKGDDAVIDTFVMSCRAMGRQAEVAVVAELAELARTRGCTRLIGEYLPTARNGVVSDLCPRLGFAVLETTQHGARYALDLTVGGVEWPAAITRDNASVAAIA